MNTVFGLNSIEAIYRLFQGFNILALFGIVAYWMVGLSVGPDDAFHYSMKYSFIFLALSLSLVLCSLVCIGLKRSRNEFLPNSIYFNVFLPTSFLLFPFISVGVLVILNA